MKNKVKKNLKKFFTNFWKVLKRPDMRILPGQLAFFFVLAIVPTITTISFVATLINISTDVIYTFISNAFSSDVANLLLFSKMTMAEGYKFVFVTFVGYFIASNGADSIILTTNAIYGEKNYTFFRRRIKAMVMTLFLILLFIFMLIVPVFGSKIVSLVQYVNINANVTEKITYIMNILQGPITWFIIYIFIKIIYKLAPNKSVSSKIVGYGALFTSFGWIIATSIFSYYITHYANITALYGGLANLVILMLWIYLLAYIFTIGLALNYRREEEELEKTNSIKLEEEDVKNEKEKK